jgi:hypothetical protein
MARFGAKMARVGDSRKALTDAPPVFKKHVTKFANYALVRLNAQKTRFKSRTADPRFGHLFKKTKKPFFPKTIYSRFVFGDVIEYGLNVAKISKVHFDKLLQITTLLQKNPPELLHVLDDDVQILIRFWQHLDQPMVRMLPKSLGEMKSQCAGMNKY